MPCTVCLFAACWMVHIVRHVDMGDPMEGRGLGHQIHLISRAKNNIIAATTGAVPVAVAAVPAKERINAMRAIINISTNFDVGDGAGVSFVV